MNAHTLEGKVPLKELHHSFKACSGEEKYKDSWRGRKDISFNCKTSFILFLCDFNDSLLMHFSVFFPSYLWNAASPNLKAEKTLQSNLPVLGLMSTLSFTYK